MHVRRIGKMCVHYYKIIHAHIEWENNEQRQQQHNRRYVCRLAWRRPRCRCLYTYCLPREKSPYYNRNNARIRVHIARIELSVCCVGTQTANVQKIKGISCAFMKYINTDSTTSYIISWHGICSAIYICMGDAHARTHARVRTEQKK